mmetsp:Transcript_16606/g.46883  ORF Transcript_16606/g.46883 Transcript_16606/m.46883 type:complete len:292 (-) Transcript_16606:793-1668(-)
MSDARAKLRLRVSEVVFRVFLRTRVSWRIRSICTCCFFTCFTISSMVSVNSSRVRSVWTFCMTSVTFPSCSSCSSMVSLSSAISRRISFTVAIFWRAAPLRPVRLSFCSRSLSSRGNRTSSHCVASFSRFSVFLAAICSSFAMFSSAFSSSSLVRRKFTSFSLSSSVRSVSLLMAGPSCVWFVFISAIRLRPVSSCRARRASLASTSAISCCRAASFSFSSSSWSTFFLSASFENSIWCRNRDALPRRPPRRRTGSSTRPARARRSPGAIDPRVRSTFPISARTRSCFCRA